MVFDSSGNLFVSACSFDGRICIYPPGSATPVAYYQNPTNFAPVNIAFGPSGTLYAVDYGDDFQRGAPNNTNQTALVVYPPGIPVPTKVIEIGDGYSFADSIAVSP